MFCSLREGPQLPPLLESNASLSFQFQVAAAGVVPTRVGTSQSPDSLQPLQGPPPETVTGLFSQQTQQRRRTPNPVSARFSTELPCLCRADPGPWPVQSYEELFSLTLTVT